MTHFRCLCYFFLFISWILYIWAAIRQRNNTTPSFCHTYRVGDPCPVTLGVLGSKDLSVSQIQKGPPVESNRFTGRVEMFFRTKGW